MVPAMVHQKGVLHEQRLRELQPEAEKRPKESDIPHMGRIEQAERLQDTPDQTISRTGKGRLSVLLFQWAALFGRIQPQTERHSGRAYRNHHRKDC